MTAFLFMGAAPEAVALQLLTHRYDACSTKEGCAPIFRSATNRPRPHGPAHYMPARAKNLRNCAAIGRMLESRRRAPELWSSSANAMTAILNNGDKEKE